MESEPETNKHAILIFIHEEPDDYRTVAILCDLMECKPCFHENSIGKKCPRLHGKNLEKQIALTISKAKDHSKRSFDKTME